MTAQTSSQYFLANIQPYLTNLKTKINTLEDQFEALTAEERTELALKVLHAAGVSIPATWKGSTNHWARNIVRFDPEDIDVNITVTINFSADEPEELRRAKRADRYFNGRYVTVDQFAKFVRLKTKTKTDAVHAPEALAEYWAEWVEYVCTLSGAK